MADCIVKYNIVMFGKTGKGKSTLGNVLLDRADAFESSYSASSCTKYSTLQANIIHGIQLNVVDTPGLMDTVDSEPQVLMRIYDAMSLCEEGFDAFILVMKFGDKYTEEEIRTVDILERAFGPEFFKVCIIVMTHGELFDMQNLSITFDEWVEINTAPFKGIFEKCCGRVHLFYNKSNGEKQSKPVGNVLRQIKNLPGKYLTSTFDQHVKKRENICVSFKVPQLHANIQEQNSLLMAFIEKTLSNVNDISTEDIYPIEAKAIQLYQFIDTLDNGDFKMSTFQCEVLNHILTLHRISQSKNKRQLLETLLKYLKENQISKKSIMSSAISSLVSWFITAATSSITPLAAFVGGSAVTHTCHTIIKIYKRMKDGKAIKDIEEKLKNLDTDI